MRSRPMPVSIDGLGRSMRSPGPRWSYCMNTRFQNSRNRSPSCSGRARRPALQLVALVEEDLRAGTARTGVARRPEIVASGDADDLVVGEARHLLPDAVGVLVVVIDGHQQPLGVEAVHLGDQLPRQRDRPLLEVVAEGEVAEHLEEGVMPRRVADVVQVVVLAAGAHALLRGRCPRIGTRLLAGEHVLERHHAGRGEHQGRVVARHQRRRGDHLVAVLAEVVEKGRPDLIDGRHDVLAWLPAWAQAAAFAGVSASQVF